MKIAFSPCPNDTFLFHAWVKGLIPGVPHVIPHLADVQQLNEWMSDNIYTLTKASIAAYASNREEYVMLPVGAALGYGNGPKIISKKGMTLKDLSKKKIAIPGKSTTAYYLLKKLCPPPKEEIFTTYENIIPMIQNEEVDCGIIIHETRFTFMDAGLIEVADLGSLWEKTTTLPLPLGGLFAKRGLGSEKLDLLTHTLRKSLEHAWKNPQDSQEYILQNSQEKHFPIVKQHIDLYVTSETLNLSEKGITSIEKLLDLPHKEWLWQTKN